MWMVWCLFAMQLQSIEWVSQLEHEYRTSTLSLIVHVVVRIRDKKLKFRIRKKYNKLWFSFVNFVFSCIFLCSFPIRSFSSRVVLLVFQHVRFEKLKIKIPLLSFNRISTIWYLNNRTTTKRKSITLKKTYKVNNTSKKAKKKDLIWP